MFYNFVTETDTGQHNFLTYQSEENIEIGQITALPLRNQKVLGICVGETQQKFGSSQVEQGSVSSKSFKIKHVDEIYPIIIHQNQLEIILNSGKFSWNKMGSIVRANLQPIKENLNKIKKLSAKQTQNIKIIDLNQNVTESKLSTRSTQVIKTPIRASSERNFFTYYDHDIVLRIMYLIRNEVDKFTNIENSDNCKHQLLIIFPDTNTLEQIKGQIISKIKLDLNLDEPIQIFTYHSNNSVKDNNYTIMSLLENATRSTNQKDFSKKIQILFTTRSGLFLPLQNLKQLILVDEADNNYIQEQNELYFDTRDLSFLLSQIWGSDYYWVSQLPSVRSASFQSFSELFEKSDITNKPNNKLFYGLSIHEKNVLADETDLFSQATLDLIQDPENQRILLIHPRRGSFRLTKCANCGHLWQCPNCDAPLTAYRNNDKDLDLICNHCQTNFTYPNECPECHKSEISSFLSGIEQLNQYLETTYKEYELIPYTGQSESLNQLNFTLPSYSENYSNISGKFNSHKQIVTTTKLIDPLLPYSQFDLIIFVQAHNILSGTDYLSTEEMIQALFKLLLRFNQPVANDRHHQPYLIIDTPYPELPFFQEFKAKIQDVRDYPSALKTYLSFINTEKDLRQKYALPPFYNTLLFTTQEKNQEIAKNKVLSLHKFLTQSIKPWPELSLTPPYPAKLIKRKGYFSYHILLKYPKKFNHLNDLYQAIEYTIRESRVQTRLNPRHLF